MSIRKASCHCGSVQFEITLSDGLKSVRRCDCSFCAMRGAVAVSAKRDDLKITAGEDTLTLYQFNTGVAEHYFCSKCGIYTHHRRRSNPEELGINVACLEGLSPFDFAEVIVNNGKVHPKDAADGDYKNIVGVLKFETSP